MIRPECHADDADDEQGADADADPARRRNSLLAARRATVFGSEAERAVGANTAERQLGLRLRREAQGQPVADAGMNAAVGRRTADGRGYAERCARAPDRLAPERHVQLC